MQLWMAAVILLLTAAGVYFLLSSGRLGKKLKIALVCALAVLLAVQGFSWMDSKRKLDLYLSVPVSSRKRFAVIYLNGAAIFAVCYLAMLLPALATCAVMGAVTV